MQGGAFAKLSTTLSCGRQHVAYFMSAYNRGSRPVIFLVAVCNLSVHDGVPCLTYVVTQTGELDWQCAAAFMKPAFAGCRDCEPPLLRSIAVSELQVRRGGFGRSAKASPGQRIDLGDDFA